MVFYNVFVAFVGLNNNTILAMQNIEFLVRPIPRSSRKGLYRSDTDPEFTVFSAALIRRLHNGHFIRIA